MILQITFDDKFVDYVVEQFSDYSSMSRIVLLTYDYKSIKYSKKIDKENIITYKSREYYELFDSLEQYNAVIMHGLFDPMQYEVIRKLPNKVKLAWVMWGSEIYSRSENRNKCFSIITKSIVKIHDFVSIKVKGKPILNREVPIEILKRVDFLLGSSLEIFNDVKGYLNKSIKHLCYSYYTIEEVIGKDLINKFSSGNNLMVGNSSSAENNHIEILYKLKKNKTISNLRCFFPLSYGEQWIKNIINSIGKFFLGDKFVPLLNFIDRNKYNEIMLSCGVYISNHHRPNAFGNILTALWLGLRVFVSDKNIQTRFLKNLGLKVNIIEKDLNTAVFPLSTLPMEEVLYNRKIIERFYGKEQMKNNINNIVKTLCVTDN